MVKTFDIYFVEINVRGKTVTSAPLDSLDRVQADSNDDDFQQTSEKQNIQPQTFNFDSQQEIPIHEINPTPRTISTVTIYFGIRLSTELLAPNDFYKKIGFFKKEEIVALFPTGSTLPFFFKIGNQTDAGKLAFIIQWTLVLIPADPQRKIFPYNDRYPTGIVTANQITDREIADILYQAQFPLGPAGKTVDYRVEPLSLQRKRRKKNAMRI